MFHVQFSKTRRAAVAATGLLLVATFAPTVAAAGPIGGRPAHGVDQIVPLSAELQISRTTDAGKAERETQHLDRDSAGRTRTEAGSTVTISDPASKTTLVLDTTTHTFQLQNATPAPDAADRSTDKQQLTSAPRELGKSTISGVAVEGREYTVNLPAHGTLPARTKTVTLWLSIDLQLAVRTRVVDETGAVTTQTYTDIKAGADPAASLFAVPSGYRVAGIQGTGNGVRANCPISNDDPVLLTSFGYTYLDSRYVTAYTDLLAGCVFVADGYYFEYPLGGVPTTPLLLPYDQWFVADCYCPVPYLPYVAFGDIAFVAANPIEPDITTKDSLIVLTIFPG
jgi:hypothetical protein